MANSNGIVAPIDYMPPLQIFILSKATTRNNVIPIPINPRQRPPKKLSNPRFIQFPGLVKGAGSSFADFFF